MPGTARRHDQALSDREQAAVRALARQVAALLEPDLTEIRRLLDVCNGKLDELLALTARHQQQHQ